ncbi:MAG: CpaF family protein, partial [Candidatus Gastranaerophilales bacterium]|nr:CpaF family protein [Candidatus Gastranaerophilales bacterium]
MQVSQEKVAELIGRVTKEVERNRNMSDADMKNFIQTMVHNDVLREQYLSINEQYELINQIYNSIKKLGVLQPLLDDKGITEIMINGPSDIFIERDGRLMRAEESFADKTELEDIVQRIVSRVNREVTAASPICDARLEDGSRINIVLDPIALNGPIVTIRKFPEKVINFQDLISWGAISAEAAEFLEACVRAKYNIFVSGGTGSGKTTFLNALSNFIPKDERIITIEDSAELQIQNVENLVRLETRNANTEGKGAITIRDLIKSSLRMRPERIVVGEVRGAEALDMLQAMNTGHDGSLSTGHANSPSDMLSRLETMVLTGANFPIEAIRQQIASALDLIVHLGRLSDKSRKTLYITEVLGY